MAAVPSIGRASRVEGAIAPEADITRALYEEHANQVFRYCLHQLGSREEAEDAVQSTFLNAFRGIKRGVVPELEAAWLFKIAHNVCLSRRRSAWRRGRLESAVDFEVIEELTPAPPHRADELIGLQEVLERMPETQRHAILLREWQGLSYREIAAELELSQAAVETLIFRARRSLANGLEQPPESKRGRVARAFDWGNVFAGLKAVLIGGSVAAKVAATVAVVSATTVVAAEPLQHQRHQVANVPRRVHPAVRLVTQIAAPVQHTTSSVAPSAPAAPATAVHKRRTASRVRRAIQAALAPAATPPETPVSEQSAAAPAPSEPAAQPSRSDTQQGNQEHGRQQDGRTTSAAQPQTPVASGSSDQTVPTTDASTHDANGHSDHGGGNSKDNKGGGNN